LRHRLATLPLCLTQTLKMTADFYHANWSMARHPGRTVPRNAGREVATGKILGHVAALNPQHVRRILGDCGRYCHYDRIHDSLEKDTPGRRSVEVLPVAPTTVVTTACLGGLDLRYA
jgi:hypothetical protein